MPVDIYPLPDPFISLITPAVSSTYFPKDRSLEVSASQPVLCHVGIFLKFSPIPKNGMASAQLFPQDLNINIHPFLLQVKM